MDMKKERSLFAVFLIMVFLLEAADTVQACDVTPSVAFGKTMGLKSAPMEMRLPKMELTG